MFSRKRANSNPNRNQKPSPATLAALQGATRAFVKPSSSNAALSSSAAAAALRANPSAPIQVGDVQTKRMQRRGSVSSNGSAPGELGRSRPALQRQNSSGSMSERSFRGPSPNRSSQNYGGPSNGLDLYAPPVPAIPKNLQEQSRRRSTSIDAPPRVSSPVYGGRGMSVDRGANASQHRQQATRSPNLESVNEREDSIRRSINFSRPMSPSASPRSSPVPQVSHQGKSGWFTEPVTPQQRTTGLRNEVSVGQSPDSTQADLEFSGQAVRAASEKPVSKKQHAANIEATYLSKGSMQAKPTGTAVQGSTTASPVSRQPAKVDTRQAISSTALQTASPTTYSPVTQPSKPKPQAASLQKSSLASDIQRSNSVSPAPSSRSAHFLDTGLEVANGVKHKPPPRSVSPAKSALKRNATSPGRTGSPAARFSSAVSETSDTFSEDGRSSARKKKNVRVSFDEGTVETKPDSPPTSPIRSGLSASRWSGQTAVEDDIDEIMKPRPALPSFGSLRNRNARPDDVAEKVTETVNSSMANSVSTIGEPLDGSKDNNLGNIVAQDFVKKSGGREPLPPEVTSVEGSGYVSDSDVSSINTAEITSNTARPPTPPHAAHAVNKSAVVEGDDADVKAPAIAVQPPTPKAEEEQKSDMFAVPGGWGEDTDTNSARKISSPEPAEQKVVSTDPSLPKPIAAPRENKPVESIEQVDEHEPDAYRRSIDQEAALQTLDEETESDGDSIYSDAEEDLSDIGGFASLDAIVESPAVSTPPQLPKLDTSPKTPLRNVQNESGSPTPIKQEPGSQSPPEDWNQATTYWSGLSAERKKEVEREEAIKTAQAASPSPTTTAPQQKPKKKRPVQPAAPAPQSTAPRQSRQAAQPVKPALKQTMRAQPAPQQAPAPIQPRTSMRRSMRGPPPGPDPAQSTMRQSMRGPPTAPAPNQSTMRQSMRSGNSTMRNEDSTARSPVRPGGMSASRYSHSDTEPRGGALQKKGLPSNTPTGPATRTLRNSAPQGQARPKATRHTSLDDNDSDASESSFRRSRPKPQGGGMSSIKNSMREAPAQPKPPPSSRRPMSMMGPARPQSPDLGNTRSSRLSVRSLSPTGSLFRRKFRGTPAESDGPTMRASKDRPSSKGSMFSFGGKKENEKIRPMSSSSLAKAPAPRAPPARRFKSRFADSSDEEDEVLPSTYRSRFNDSDDDDDVPPLPLPMPKDLTPVRGIPRRPGDDDGSSTDLEGEDSERDEVRHTTATSNLRNKEGGKLASGSLRDSKHARIADDVPDPSPILKEKKKRSFFGLGRKKGAIQPGQVSGLSQPMTPPTREQTVSPIPQSPTSPTRSPKLQRRVTPQRIGSDSWPLPPPIPLGELQRPMSSDGPTTNGMATGPRRPRMHERILSNETTVTAPMVRTDPTTQKQVIVGRSGKKKKFQGLRRAFGLND